MAKERELKDNVKKDRNKEIEMVIRQLEADATAAREDCERVAENRIKYVLLKTDILCVTFTHCFTYLFLESNRRQILLPGIVFPWDLALME